MNKILSLVLFSLSIAVSANAEPSTSPVSGMKVSTTKIEDLEKLVAEGKGRKIGEGVYSLPDKFVLNGKEHPKTQYGGVASSQNLEYFLLQDTNMPLEYGATTKLFDKTARLLWMSKTLGGGREGGPDVLISNKGNVLFLYGQFSNVHKLRSVGKSESRVDVFETGDSIQGVTIENLYNTHHDAQFAKNSEILFILAYASPEQLILLGIDETGKIIFFEKVNPSVKGMPDWYARVYFNPKRNQILIDSSGIGENPPMLSYWSLPQKILFNKKTVKGEVIYNASFADNDDVLLLVRKNDGSKIVRRLSPDGKEKYNKSDVNKMDAEEQMLSNEKPFRVKSLSGCENGNMFRCK